MLTVAKLPLSHQLSAVNVLVRRAFVSKNSFTKSIQYIKDNLPPREVNLFPEARYGGENMVTMLAGSSLIGQQGAGYIKTLFGAASVPVVFDRVTVGPDTDRFEYIVSVLRNRSAINIDLQHDPKQKHMSLLLNNDLDLYACVTKMHSFPGFNCRYPGLDITLITQNNTGDYTKLEYEPVDGVVETLSFYDEAATRRYLTFVYEHAKKHCRQRITFGHKMEMLPLSDGSFIRIAKQLHCDRYPDIEIKCMEINNLVRNLIQCPQQFDIICTNERYGTFLMSICGSVCGGIGLFSACERGDHHAVFKPLQTKLSVTDCRTLSPYGIVRACVELLIYLGNEKCARALWTSLLETMLKAEIKTEDFGGTDTPEYVICHIVNKLKCSKV